MGVYIVYISFVTFVIMLLIVSFYFINSLIVNRFLKRKIAKEVLKIKEVMKRHLQEDKNISNDEIEKLRKLALNKVGLQAFYICYKDYINENGYDEKIRDYAGKVISYKTLLKNRIVRERYRRSYILYMLSEFQINTDEIEEFALNSLNQNSIYVRNNALRVIQNTGNTSIILRAIEKINTSRYYFNYKILVDFIDSFKGDMKILNKSLLSALDSYNLRL